MKESMSTVSNIVINRDRDCLGCRITSGCGLIGAALYIAYNSKNIQAGPAKIGIATISTILGILGTARIFNLPPFRDLFKHEQ